MQIPRWPLIGGNGFRHKRFTRLWYKNIKHFNYKDLNSIKLTSARILKPQGALSNFLDKTFKVYPFTPRFFLKQAVRRDSKVWRELTSFKHSIRFRGRGKKLLARYWRLHQYSLFKSFKTFKRFNLLNQPAIFNLSFYFKESFIQDYLHYTLSNSFKSYTHGKLGLVDKLEL